MSENTYQHRFIDFDKDGKPKLGVIDIPHSNRSYRKKHRGQVRGAFGTDAIARLRRQKLKEQELKEAHKIAPVI